MPHLNQYNFKWRALKFKETWHKQKKLIQTRNFPIESKRNTLAFTLKTILDNIQHSLVFMTWFYIICFFFSLFSSTSSSSVVLRGTCPSNGKCTPSPGQNICDIFRRDTMYYYNGTRHFDMSYDVRTPKNCSNHEAFFKQQQIIFFLCSSKLLTLVCLF